MHYPIEILFVSKKHNFLRGIKLPIGLLITLLATFIVIATLTLILFFRNVHETFSISKIEQENKLLLKKLAALYGSIKNNNDNFDEQITQDYRDRTYLQIAYIHPDVWSMGIGGKTYAAPNTKLSSSTYRILTGIYESIDVLKGKYLFRKQSLSELKDKSEKNIHLWAHIPSTNPVPNGHFSSGFGYRVDPIKKTVRMHWGIDLGAPRGTPIYASANGVVSQTKWSKGGYGWVIDVDHGYGFKTRYAHCHTMLVKPGDVVKRGQIIATVGSTGRSIAPHLHYEVHVSGIKVNPRYYINSVSVIVD